MCCHGRVVQKTGPLVPLRELRRAHALTHDALAEKMRLEQGYRVTGDALSSVETGRRAPSGALLTSIAHALQVDLDEIHRRDEKLFVTVRSIRRAWGLTLPALADRIADLGHSVTADGLNNVELGHRRASDPLLRAWAEALRLHPLDVVQEPKPSDRQRQREAQRAAVPA